jgi:hypothetical protein
MMFFQNSTLNTEKPMIIKRKIIVYPDYSIDEFVCYGLRLTDMVPWEDERNPLLVHGIRNRNRPAEMLLVELEPGLNHRQAAKIFNHEGCRPADYGELRGFWDDNVPADPVVIIPDNDEVDRGICFYYDEEPQALLVAKPEGCEDVHFATTNLKNIITTVGLMFLITKA